MRGYWVYILKCVDGSYYTGRTTDLEIRIAQHKIGKGNQHTRRRLPVELVFSQQLPDAESAYQVERQIKRWSRGKKEALIAEQWDMLKWLSKKPEFRKTPAPKSPKD